MKTGNITTYLLKALLPGAVFFILMSGVYYYMDGAVDFGKTGFIAALVGLSFSATDKAMKKAVRGVMVQMHGEEKVKANEERSARK